MEIKRDGQVVSRARNLSPVTTFINAVRIDDSPTSSTSSALDVSAFKDGRIYMDIDSTGVSTHDLLIEVQYSPDNSNWSTEKFWAWGDMRYEDTETASGLEENYPVKDLGRYIRIVITGTNTTAGNYFDVTIKGEFWS